MRRAGAVGVEEDEVAGLDRAAVNRDADAELRVARARERDVGIATSNATAISATASSGVVEHSISGPYWGSRYVGARRVA